MKIFAYLGMLVGAVAVSAILASGQTAPPAEVSGDTRPDFSGTWSLDRSLSTAPNQMSLAPAANDNRPSDRGNGGGFGGFGRQRRGGAASRGAGEVLTPIEQSRLKAFTDELKTSFATLGISHHDPSFVVSDAQGRAQFFQATSVSDENYLGTETVTSSTHWDGSRLVTGYLLGSHLTLVYTYTLLPKTKQLVLRVTRKSEGDQRTTGPEIKLVYKLTPTSPQ